MLLKLLELLVSGLALGAIYALLALAMTVIWATTDVIDISIGAQATLAGMIAAALAVPFGYAAGLAAGLATGALIGLTFAAFHARGLLKDPMPVVLATFGALIIAESAILTAAGTQGLHLQAVPGVLMLGDAVFTRQSLVNVAVALCAYGALAALLRFSPLGLTMRACAVSDKAARLAGIPVRRTQFLTFVLGGLVAGLGGLMAGMTAGLSYASPFNLTVSGLSGALLFGSKTPTSAFGGGLVIGVAEALGAGYLPSGWAAGTSSLVILIVLATSRLPAMAFSGGRP
ncbi:MAG: branched-chain amino acid ABC transporter permease [Rubrivivax sp.]